MPRKKTVLRYCAGIVDYEYRDETHWVQMVGPTLTRCDNIAKTSGWGLVSQFNYQTGSKASWYGKLPDSADPELWVEDHHIETYETELDVS